MIVVGAAHCPWFIESHYEYGINGKWVGQSCALTNKDCPLYVENPVDCKSIGRIMYLLRQSRGSRKTQGMNKIDERGKDYLLYAFNKIRKTEMWKLYCSTYSLVQTLQKRVGEILQERCRKNEECPYKALLPEYDVT